MTLKTMAATALAAAGALGCHPEVARAQDDYPSQAITFVVPWGAGGRTDVVGRLLAEAMAEELDADIAVINRAGAAGAIGTKSVLDAPADGHTVLVTTPGNHILGPVQRDVGYEPEDFAAIGRAAGGAVVLAAGEGAGFEDASGLVEAAGESPATFASARNTLPYLATQAIADAAGIELTHIPVKGDAEAVPMVLGGHVDMVAASGAPAVQGHVGSGAMTPLVVFSEERMPMFPDTPTARELGYDVTASAWTGLAVPAGTPEAALAALREAMARAVESPAFREAAEQAAIEVDYADAEAFAEQWSRERDTFAAVVGE